MLLSTDMKDSVGHYRESARRLRMSGVTARKSGSLGRLSDDYLTPEGPRGKLVLTVHAEKAWAICVRSMRGEGLSSARSPVDASVPPRRDLLRRGQGSVGGALRAALGPLAGLPRPGCQLLR